MSTYNKYRIPVPKDLLQRMDRTSSPAHVWSHRNAVEFVVPQTTPVLVAAYGEVAFVSDDSNIRGPDPSYWTATNFITIKHPFGEYSRYDHLAYQSAKVRVGHNYK